MLDVILLFISSRLFQLQTPTGHSNFTQNSRDDSKFQHFKLVPQLLPFYRFHFPSIIHHSTPSNSPEKHDENRHSDNQAEKTEK
jgi:hypothetical protein